MNNIYDKKYGGQMEIFCWLVVRIEWFDCYFRVLPFPLSSHNKHPKLRIGLLAQAYDWSLYSETSKAHNCPSVLPI